MTGSPKRSGLVSMALHGGAIVLVLLVTGRNSPLIPKLHETWITPRDIISDVITPHRMTGGGGGGQSSPTPATFGKLPPANVRQFTPPMVVILNEDPKLPMPPTLAIDPAAVLPQIDAPNYGAPHGAEGPPSGGPGTGGGVGKGNHGGVGDRRGPGLGNDGDDGGVSGDSSIRGVTTQPALVWKTEPVYSDEARKAKLQGVVVLQIEVDARGQARNIRVIQSLGLGLDDRAMEAVRMWKFRPATRNGKPVASPAQVQVTFRLL
jgi:protein TonB